MYVQFPIYNFQCVLSSIENLKGGYTDVVEMNQVKGSVTPLGVGEELVDSCTLCCKDVLCHLTI